MIRISVYHWLPVADNVLPEVVSRLEGLVGTMTNDIYQEHDAVSYSAVFKHQRAPGVTAVFPMLGKINQRGFAQHTLNIAPIMGLPLGTLLDEIAPALRAAVSNLLLSLVPDAVRSELAVLEDGTAPFQQFQSLTLEPPIETSARITLNRNPMLAILLDTRYHDEMEAGFRVDSIQLDVPPSSSDSVALASRDGRALLFYATNYHPDELTTRDSVIYKYCALITFARHLDQTIGLLKSSRDHLIPLRRRLALALQGNTDEYFELLTQMKKYLTYVNTKLPIVQKVLSHLANTRASHTFSAKISTFDEPAKVFNYPTISSIEEATLMPNYLITHIEQDSQRLQVLFEESLKEIQIVSNEVSQVLEGILLSEQLQVSVRTLDTFQAMLELERSTKNLAYAQKAVTIILSAILGATLADALTLEPLARTALSAAFLGFGYLFTNFTIFRHSDYYRLVIPINAPVPRAALMKLGNFHKIKRTKVNGSHIVQTWRDRLTFHTRLVRWSRGQVVARLRDYETTRPPDYSIRQLSQEFDVTADFQKRGFLNSITLETERASHDINPQDLVQDVFMRLEEAGCLKELESSESSLFVLALSNLDIDLEPRLPALNRLLTLPSVELAQILATGASVQVDSLLSRHDLTILQDLLAHPRDYVLWLKQVSRDSQDPEQTHLAALLGAHNLQSKLELLQKLEARHA